MYGEKKVQQQLNCSAGRLWFTSCWTDFHASVRKSQNKADILCVDPIKKTLTQLQRKATLGATVRYLVVVGSSWAALRENSESLKKKKTSPNSRKHRLREKSVQLCRQPGSLSTLLQSRTPAQAEPQAPSTRSALFPTSSPKPNVWLTHPKLRSPVHVQLVGQAAR